MKIALTLLLLSTTLLAKGNKGLVLSVSASPNINESEFKRSDNNTTRTYVGTKYRGTLGYRFGFMSILGTAVKSDLENRSESTQKREDFDYGLTFRFHPISLIFLQSSYLLTNTKLSYSDRDTERFEGARLTAGAGIRIPTPSGTAFTISGTYILSSKMRQKGGSDADVIDESGYTLNIGGSIGYTF